MFTRPSIWVTAVLSVAFIIYCVSASTFDARVFIALVALCVSLIQLERANSVVASVYKTDQAFRTSLDENNRKMFSYLTIIIRNEGITLHDPKLTIEFITPEDGGHTSFALVPSGEKHGKLEKGMYAEFSLKSYQLIQPPPRGDMGRKMLVKLTDGFKQKAYLCLYSHGYLAYRWRVGSWLERVKQLWNREALKMNIEQKRIVQLPDGSKRLKLGAIPTFSVPEPKVVGFCKSLASKDIE